MSRKYIIRQVGNHKMKVEKDGQGIQRFLRGWKDGKEREPELIHIIKETITNKKMTCFDIGANVGYVTLLMCELSKGGKVYALEPDPHNYYLLNENITLNSYNNKCKTYNLAVSDKTGLINFYPGKEECNLGSIRKHYKSANKPILVKSTSLTDFINNIKKYPNLIKMDIEGHETEVLWGFKNTISRTKDFQCTIVMELHPQFYTSEQKMEKILWWYLANGFKTKYVVSAGVPQPDLFKKWGYEPDIIFSSGRGLYSNFKDDHMVQACAHINMQFRPPKKDGTPVKPSPKIARFLVLARH